MLHSGALCFSRESEQTTDGCVLENSTINYKSRRLRFLYLQVPVTDLTQTLTLNNCKRKIWLCLLQTSICDIDSNSGVNGWFGEESGEHYLCGTGCTADTAPCLWGVRHTCPSHMERKCLSPGPCYTCPSHKCL